MERRARSRSRPRDRRERGGSVRSRALWHAGRARPPVRRVAAQGSLRRRGGSDARARRASPSRPRGCDDRPRGRRASHARAVRAGRPAHQPVLRRGGTADRGVSPRTKRRARRPAVRARDRERAQRSERAHVGRARIDARCARDARMDGRQTDGATPGPRAPTSFAAGGTSTGCGRSTSATAPPQRLLGAAHGAVSNQLALLQASPIEDARDVAAMLERTAIVEGPLANWSTDDELPLEHKGKIRRAVVPRGTGDRHLRRPVPTGRSSSSPARSSRGRPALTGRGPTSATGRRATATRS